MSTTITALLYILVSLLCVTLTSRIPRRAFVGSPLYEQKRAKDYSYFLAPIMVFTLFWGLRYDVGTDYLEYTRVYESTDWMAETHGALGYEKGFILTNKFFQLLGFSSISIFIYSSFVFVFALYFWCHEETRRYSIFAVFFFMTGPVLFAQNGTRQMLAMSFFLCGLVFLGRKKIIPWLIFVFLAYMNHRSIIVPSVIMTVLFLVKPLHINKYVLIIINILLFLFGRELQVLFINRIEGVATLLAYENYVEGALEKVNTELVYNTGIGRFLLVIVNSIVFLSQDLFLTGKKDARYYAYWCFLIGVNLTPLFWGNETLGRLSLSFSLLSWATLALSMTALVNSKKEIAQMIVICVIARQLISFCISVVANSSGCGSYQMIDLF